MIRRVLFKKDARIGLQHSMLLKPALIHLAHHYYLLYFWWSVIYPLTKLNLLALRESIVSHGVIKGQHYICVSRRALINFPEDLQYSRIHKEYKYGWCLAYSTQRRYCVIYCTVTKNNYMYIIWKCLIKLCCMFLLLYEYTVWFILKYVFKYKWEINAIYFMLFC